MSRYNTIGPIIDHIEEGYTDLKAQALDFLHGFCFEECEAQECEIAYAKYIASNQDIDMYYDYGADYYFFVQNQKTDKQNN